MAICYRCKLELHSSKFYNRGKHRLAPYCKQCANMYSMIRWNKNKAKVVAHFGGKCSDCGFVGHPALYDFHHNDPTAKKEDWGTLRRKSWSNILKELNKCTILCVMCHRLRHLNPLQWPTVALSS